jgi:hypothetical protein
VLVSRSAEEGQKADGEKRRKDDSRRYLLSTRPKERSH